MACSGDLGCKLSVVGPLVFLGILSTKGDHAPRKAGQVSHLVIQNSPSPLSNVGQTPRRDIQQIGLDGLRVRRKTQGWGGGEEKRGDSVSHKETVAGLLGRALFP